MTSISLGVDIDSVHDPKNEIFTFSNRFSTTTGLQGLRFFVLTLLPEKVLKAIKVRIVPKDIADFYYHTVSKVIKHRLENNIVRPDFIHLMLQARRNELKAEKTDETLNDAGFSTVQELLEVPSNSRIEWTDYDIAATSASFFFGGTDSTTTLLCFAIYELTLNPEVQEKLLTEIDNVREELEGAKLTYESLQQMKYLDMVITETLRKWPPFGLTNRRCTKDYNVKNSDGTEVTINKGEILFFPIYEIQRDPKYYPEPEKFDPERFSDENRHNLNQNAFLPFGVGPRNCIGSRLTLMHVKCFLYYLLAYFDVQISDRTDVPIRLEMKSAGLNAKNGFWFHLIPRGK